jgi:hypothetical protein
MISTPFFWVWINFPCIDFPNVQVTYRYNTREYVLGIWYYGTVSPKPDSYFFPDLNTTQTVHKESIITRDIRAVSDVYGVRDIRYVVAWYPLCLCDVREDVDDCTIVIVHLDDCSDTDAQHYMRVPTCE